MAIIKRINVNKIERTMNKIIELSSKISFFQEELVHIKSQMDNNKSLLSAGIISGQTFKGNKRNFGRRRKEIVREINQDIKILLKLSSDAKKDLKTYKL